MNGSIVRKCLAEILLVLPVIEEILFPLFRHFSFVYSVRHVDSVGFDFHTLIKDKLSQTNVSGLESVMSCFTSVAIV